jgi:hypothetical protein
MKRKSIWFGSATALILFACWLLMQSDSKPQSKRCANVSSADSTNPPVAKAVPGQPGFVFSPFNNKIVDVSGITSGTLIADPQFPEAEKKHFRAP